MPVSSEFQVRFPWPAGSTRTRFLLSRARAGSRASRPATETALPSQAQVASDSLAGSMNSSVPPSACTSAKPRANGVNGVSPPRMFSNHAIEAGSLITAASCFASRSNPAICSPLSCAPRPACSSKCGNAGASSGGGRSVHTASIGLRCMATMSSPALV